MGSSSAERPTEVTPINNGTSATQDETKSIMRITLAGAAMILASAGLINYNKYVITEAFPFAAHLVLCHMVFGSLCSMVLYVFAPSLYPSLTDPEKRVTVHVTTLFTRAAPISLFFAGSLVLSNFAYLFASVAFLQMMKQGNVIIVYVLSLLVGLEALRTRSVLLLSFILLCTGLTVQGELNFSLIGFLVQGGSQLLECLRLILQSFLLSGSMKLDVLTYNLIVMPLCALALLTLVMVNHFTDGSLFSGGLMEPGLSDFTQHWKLLLPNFLLAFLLNVLIAVFIKVSSALSMVLTSLLKDVFIVVLSVMLLGEVVSRQQVIGFVLQMMGIAAWSLIKSFPKHFEDGFLMGFVNVANAVLAPPPPLHSKEEKLTA
mmetsp:Transcript_20115/g.46881  ORF Transcript_20115/g.46881 Transcript_20115/m.46881 type:complete len:374 (+) Transcript_20115:141-1262(+)|eukprot:CAMPEP_0178431002 /NCGR_PEP_ID=MMETSP0689_2-20121128/31611_1 /TAXON_ID=160604 /ORGANISM="Amphidinium massartii, Strain CS-259" /LENGTH=373 /DNA_ID=CAMNT_0020052877 /DNA_START=82 /DNA_END=1203 /DNA_ORIENTATION=+